MLTSVHFFLLLVFVPCCLLLLLLLLCSLQYAEMEMRHRFVNHARNIWDRAVSVLPRVDQLWYKYIHMEEMCKEVAKARLVFDRWMAFEPDHAPWMAYIKVRGRP
jgi:crooked neck